MNFNKLLILLIIVFCFNFHPESLQAQNQHVDSVLTLLASCKNGNLLDTAKFEQAQSLIESAALSDREIEAIEKASVKLDDGKDQDLSFLVRFSIFTSLLSSDPPKSIAYAKEQVEAIRKSNTPHKSAILSSLLGMLRLPYRNSNQALAGLNYYKDQLSTYTAENDSLGISVCYYVLSGFYNSSGLLDQSIYNMKKSLVYTDTTKLEVRYMNVGFGRGKFRWYNNNLVLGYFYTVNGEYAEGLKYLKRTFAFGERQDSTFLSSSARYISWNMALAGRLDSIDYYLKIAKKRVDPPNLATTFQIETLVKIQQDSLEVAESLMNECWELVNRENVPVQPYAGTVHPDYYLALIRIKQGRLYEAIALLDQDIQRLGGVRSRVLEDYLLQADLYAQLGKYQQSADTYKRYIALNDSLLSDQDKFRTASFEIEQELSGKELAISKLESENHVSTLTRNYTIGLAVLLILLAAGIYFRFRSKQKANKVLEKTLSDLKNTQAQLIQSEKMASLGELTAGIAHEIQNPLNFVNNFSEVSSELLDEMKEELATGNRQEAMDLADDIKQNLEKITHHGKRADSIVKGMLEHSRARSGTKEPTDINALADEYLRLSYHGLRAKDKNFNADIKTDFDESLGNVNVIPQDIGRVLLNLFNNAFYAVNEKREQSPSEYKPTISLSTAMVGDKIEIRVTDNGNGIPKKILDKIYQPFFTTKPTGQGTGLGLSMSYDIIKAHGGELKVETTVDEGSPNNIGKREGTTFIIILPK